MTTPPIRLSSRESVARALELLTAAWRAGHVAGFSIHAAVDGVSRVSVVYAPDAVPLDLETLCDPET
jgi:hypothetical protein